MCPYLHGHGRGCRPYRGCAACCVLYGYTETEAYVLVHDVRLHVAALDGNGGCR
jgi:hypothetical protein